MSTPVSTAAAWLVANLPTTPWRTSQHVGRLAGQPEVGRVGVTHRWVFELREVDGEVRISAPDLDDRARRREWRCTDPEVLRAHLHELASVFTTWAHRVTLGALREGHRYLVVRDFTDYRRQLWSAGAELTFQHQAFLPYDGGHTVTFRVGDTTKAMYLQDDVNADLLADLDLYVEEIP